MFVNLINGVGEPRVWRSCKHCEGQIIEKESLPGGSDVENDYEYSTSLTEECAVSKLHRQNSRLLHDGWMDGWMDIGPCPRLVEVELSCAISTLLLLFPSC